MTHILFLSRELCNMKLPVSIHLLTAMEGLHVRWRRSFFTKEDMISGGFFHLRNTMIHMQNKMFSQLFPMVSEDTILRELHDLIKNGILLKKGKTKGAKYVLKS